MVKAEIGTLLTMMSIPGWYLLVAFHTGTVVRIAKLEQRLAELEASDDVAAAAQNEVYEVGKAHYGQERLRDWFRALYETLLGSEQGPRMGSFIALFGIENSRKLIAEALTSAAASPSN